MGEITENFDSMRVPIRSSDRKTGAFPYYGAQGIIDYVHDYIFDGNYLLVAEDGENLRSLSQSVAFIASGKFWVNNHAHILKGKQGVCDTNFLCYTINNTDISGYLTGSAQPKLSQSNLNKIIVKIPPLKTQLTIVGHLKSLDDRIELNRKMNETLEEMARAIFKSWFVDFDPVHAKARGEKPAGMPDEIADLFPCEFVHSDQLNKPIPKGWEVRPLKEIIEFNPTTPLKKGVRAPYVEMSNLPEQGMSIKNFYHREFSSGSKFKNGDTLFARITPCLENGKTAFVDCLNDNEVGWGSTEFIVMRSKPKIGSFFSYLIARSDWFRAAAIGSMNGSSGRQRASKEALEQLLIAIPPEDVFEAFNTVAEIISKKIKLSHEESQNLANVRDSLLPKLISREIEV